MLELLAQVIAYSLVGVAVLVVGFFALDALTPGKLGRLIAGGNANAARVTASLLVSLGLIQWFAIFFTGADWGGLDDALVFGLVGVAVQVAGFLILDLLIPGRLGHICVAESGEPGATPAAWTVSAMHLAVALIVCASLT
jgi:uncharacterized membrane protein YjfL (UPF0719 family)